MRQAERRLGTHRLEQRGSFCARPQIHPLPACANRWAIIPFKTDCAPFRRIHSKRRHAHSKPCGAPSVVTRSGDRESGLIVAKEAAACGVPVIATMHGGLPDIVEDGHTGFLVPERDVERLSEPLGRLIAEPALRQQMGGAARLKMEREYDVRERVTELEGFYDEAIARKAHDPGR